MEVDDGSGAAPAASVQPAGEVGSPEAGKNTSEGKKGKGKDGKGLVREKIEKPKKADFRQRAHCNPLADFVDTYPVSPDHVDWSAHFPEFFARVAGAEAPMDPVLRCNTKDHPIEYSSSPVDAAVNGCKGPQVKILDVGCGFGGLLISLGATFPDKLMLGLEIREQVTNYVGERVRAFRKGADGEPSHFNVSVVRTNAQKFLVNYIRKGQLEKMFFCFPDPHFKRKNIRRRIINHGLLSAYAYMLAVGGKLYFSTDVKELFEWMDGCCKEHPLFERVSEEEQRVDVCLEAARGDTEESKRVKELGRFGHDVHYGVYRRIAVLDSAT